MTLGTIMAALGHKGIRTKYFILIHVIQDIYVQEEQS